MCGRFLFKLDVAIIPVVPSYNVAPTQSVITLVQRDGHTVLEAMRWGLIPVWAKDMEIGARMINARAETITEKASFKRPLKSQRCLIVADGFYEWPKKGPSKTPVFIHLKTKGPFGFAGLYDHWKSPEGDRITTCTIITTAANELMAAFHDRMPVILPKTAYKKWLDPSNQDLDELVELLQPYPAEKMVAYPVSPLVNSIRNNSPDCIRPAAV